MEYLIAFFIIIIIVGILANHELGRDRERIRQIIKEYSFERHSSEDTEKQEPDEGTEEK